MTIPQFTISPVDWRALRNERAFLWSVAASALLHGFLLLAFPAQVPDPLAPPEALKVTLERREPPRVTPPPPVTPPVTRPSPPKPLPRVEKPRAAPPPPPAPVREVPPAAILTVPPPPERPPAAPVIPAPALPSSPASAPAPSPPAAVEARSEAAPAPPRESGRAAAAAKPEGREERSSPDATPPSFSAAHLHNPKPHYPLNAKRRGEEGTVTLRVFVSRDGLPERISVQTSSGHASLDRAALEQVRSWRFVPARQGTQPVDAWVLVPIVFKLTSGP